MIRWHHGVAVFLVLVLSAGGCGREATEDTVGEDIDDRIEIAAVSVTRAQIVATLDTVGTLLPVRATTIVAEIDGVVQSLADSPRVIEYEEDGQQKSVALGLDIGIWVNEGDILMELDPEDYQLKLEQAQARQKLVENQLLDLLAWRRPEEVDQLEAQAAEARAAWELAEADLRRVEQLLNSSAMSVGEFDTASATARKTKAALDQVEAQLAMAEAGPTQEQKDVAKAQLAVAEVEVRQRSHDLEKTKIRAPYNGVITHRYVGVGDRVTAMPRVEIMNIADPRAVFAEVDVPERYSPDVHLDDIAEIQSPGLSENVYGVVKLIGGNVDLATRTFRVRVAIDNRPGLLRPGGFVRVRLPIESGDDALVVPRAAVSYSDGQPAVFVYKQDESVEYRPVQLGITTTDACEIRSGLTEGEWVSVSNPALLTNGIRVRLSQPALASEQLTRAAHSREETR